MALPTYDLNQVKAENPIVDSGISPAKDALQQSVSKDLASAQASYGAGRTSVGAYNPGMQTSFNEKGIRIGRNIVAQNEFNKAIETQKRAVSEYTKAAGFTDETSQAIAQTQLNDRLNKTRLELIKRGLEFDKRLADYNASEAERRQAAVMWGQLAGTVAGGLLGSYGGPAGVAAGATVGGQLGGNLATTASNG